MERRVGVILLLLVLVAAILRLPGLLDDFWLDEIWSLSIALKLRNPVDVLLSPEARWDNNHPLNTLFMWLVGDRPQWWIYRIPSYITGTASVAMAAIIMRRRGSGEAVLAALLVGLSYPLIFFSSEARGYAMVVFFALLAFDAADRYLAKPRWTSAAVFAVACVLGLLSHLSFVHILAGIVAWTTYRLTRALRPGVAALQLLRLHLVPLLGLVGIYMTFVRHLTIGGAPPTPLWKALAESVSGLVAIAGPVWMELLIAAAVLALFGWMAIDLRRRGSDLWVLLLVAIFLSPSVAILRQALLLPPDKIQPIAPRYFLVLLPFLFMAASDVLARVMRHRGVAVLFGAFLACSLWQTAWFIRVGRGQYSDAVRYMTANALPDAGSVVPVLADNAYRTRMPLEYYSRVLPLERRLHVYGSTEDGSPPVFDRGSPVWLVRHDITRHSPGVQSFEVLGRRYFYDREFTYYGLSGYSWYVYRRSER